MWAFLAASDIFRMSCEYKSSGGVTLTFFIAVRCNVAIAAAGVRLPSIHRYRAIIVPWPPGHLAPGTAAGECEPHERGGSGVEISTLFLTLP